MQIENWRKAPQQPLPANLALRASPSAQQYQYPGRVSVDYSVPGGMACGLALACEISAVCVSVFMCVIGNT